MNAKICSIDGCDDGGKMRRGLCSKHWQRFRKYGDPLHPLMYTRYDTPEESFLARVAWDGEHLIWTGVLNKNGYGQISSSGQRQAHRYAWERINGPIPAGLVIDHTCWTPACVHVDHLRLATRAENSRSRVGANRGRDLPRGVRREGERFGASVYTGGKNHWLGTFDLIADAEAAARKGRAELFGEFAGAS